MKFSKATTEELLVIAHEDENACILDKAYALIQIMHREVQIDLYDYIGIEG